MVSSKPPSRAPRSHGASHPRSAKCVINGPGECCGESGPFTYARTAHSKPLMYQSCTVYRFILITVFVRHYLGVE